MLYNFEKFSFPSIEKRGTKDKETVWQKEQRKKDKKRKERKKRKKVKKKNNNKKEKTDIQKEKKQTCKKITRQTYLKKKSWQRN